MKRWKRNVCLRRIVSESRGASDARMSDPARWRSPGKPREMRSPSDAPADRHGQQGPPRTL